MTISMGLVYVSLVIDGSIMPVYSSQIVQQMLSGMVRNVSVRRAIYSIKANVHLLQLLYPSVPQTVISMVFSAHAIMDSMKYSQEPAASVQLD